MTGRTRELTKAEYDATFSPPMLNVSDRAEAIVDLWDYAGPAVDAAYPEAGDWDWRVASVFESRDGAWQHINIPVPVDETYLVVIVNKPQREIIGHFMLDLRYLRGMPPRVATDH